MSCDTDTHFVAPFTRRNDRGEQEAVCREFVPARLVVPAGVEPRCWDCRAWFQGLELNAQTDARELRIA